MISQVYDTAVSELRKPVEEMKNVVRNIYKTFSTNEISSKICEMLKTDEIKSDVEIVFQSIEGLHEACPGHSGDWYFTGNYPTPGGNKVVNQSFINYVEGRDIRAY
jgi:amidophosphoribosyltransferase